MINMQVQIPNLTDKHADPYSDLTDEHADSESESY